MADFPDELVDLVARVIADENGGGDELFGDPPLEVHSLWVLSREAFQRRARTVLSALADAGQLILGDDPRHTTPTSGGTES